MRSLYCQQIADTQTGLYISEDSSGNATIALQNFPNAIENYNDVIYNKYSFSTAITYVAYHMK